MPARRATIEELVGSIYESALHADHWPTAIRTAMQVFESGAGSFLVADPRTGDREIYSGEGFSETWAVKVWWARYAWSNPGYHYLASHPPGSPFVSNLYMPESRWRETEFYHECLRSGGIGPYGAIHVEQTASIYGMFILWRDPKAEVYSASHARMLAGLFPHLRRASAVSRHLAACRAQRAAFVEALHYLPLACVLLDANGRVLTCNVAAERILAARRGIFLSAGRLGTASPPAQAELDHVIRRACATTLLDSQGGGGEVRIPCPPSELPLELSVSPLPLHRAVTVGSQRAAALVLLLDPSGPSRTSSQELSALFGLTAAESRTALAVARGHSPSEIADRYRLSRETVRSQLAAVFGKTGTRRQAEVARLLLRLAPEFHETSAQQEPGASASRQRTDARRSRADTVAAGPSGGGHRSGRTGVGVYAIQRSQVGAPAEPE